MSKKNEAKFEKLTKEDLKRVNKAINDKRQSLIRAIKEHYMLYFAVKKMALAQQRFEKAIEDGVEIKDDYGLPIGSDELKIQARQDYVQLRFSRRNLIESEKDIHQTWYSEIKDYRKFQEKLHEDFNRWFVGEEPNEEN